LGVIGDDDMQALALLLIHFLVGTLQVIVE
jgi:hypothetical protein